MSERHKTHNGRDVDGHFRVRSADVDDVLTSPGGEDYIRDDVRLGGAVADVGPDAGRHAARVREMIEANREDVERVVNAQAPGRGREPARRPARRHRGNH